MKKKFTEEQIVRTLTRFRNGEKATDLARELNVASHTIYDWRKRFGNMQINEAKRLKELEAENTKLKKIVADMALDIVMLKDVNSRKW
jgi:putative transposase